MNRTVLLIDDDDDIREIAQLSLELGAGWTVWCAASGAEGLSIARANAPEAILLDVMMPGMDGPATLAALREDERTRDIPVLFLTAKSRPAERDRLAGLDVSGVLGKPFDPIMLPDQVGDLLGWPR
ncbi:MAG TPA: response regulator [Gemmatimonadaceae bacterium]|nr:response regulator [Gemmatimonadaceae bacterium]